MLSNEVIEERFKLHKDVSFVKVEGDGYKVQLTVVSDEFLNKSAVARQRWVYAQLSDDITSGKLHALSMTTWTQEEWRQHNG